MAANAHPATPQDVSLGDGAARRVLVIATGRPEDGELLDEVRGGLPAERVEVAVVAPVVEQSAAKRTAGELEPARDSAERLLDDSLSRLREGGLAAEGWVGDTDPILAAEDALRSFAADEILVFENGAGHRRWFEDGLFERAQEILPAPLRMADADVSAQPAPPRPLAERAAPQAPRGDEQEVGLSPYLPGFARGDLAAVAVGVLGTILAAIFFAAGPGTQSGAGAAQGLIALAAVLVNIAHMIAITIFESVRYSGGFQRFFRTVTLVYTPLAALANLIVLLAS